MLKSIWVFSLYYLFYAFSHHICSPFVIQQGFTITGNMYYSFVFIAYEKSMCWVKGNWLTFTII
ncbi:hypothetical protein J2T02_004707 [Chitinophaga terrae (ex Kim and Jung 2007)]|nr:hypothetical protein [Chitinophaga terrae (ex Kim and Jung 2007)]